VKYNTKIRYGIRAMLEIALAEPEKGILQKDISDRQKISVKYLDNIIASLKTAGLITTTRGKKSGYRVTRKPGEIRIIDIYRAFEPEIAIVDCMSCNHVCDFSASCGAKPFWTGLNTIITEYFQSNTLEDLIKNHREKQLN
jgi:Rrf2 family protein